MLGDFSAFTAIEVNKDTLLSFATRFSKEPLFGVDEFTLATYGEFLNLHNGLFTVNMSNENNIELELTPQDNFEDFTLSFDSSRITSYNVCYTKLLRRIIISYPK